MVDAADVQVDRVPVVDGRPVEYVAALFSDVRVGDSGLFDPVAVRKLYEKCRAGRAIGFSDNMAFVGILSTLLVDEMFVRRNAPLDDAALPAVAGAAIKG